MDIDISQILSRTVGVVKDRFGQLLGMWLIFWVLQIVLFGVFAVIIGASALSLGSLEGSEFFAVGTILGIAVLYLAYFLIYGAQTAAMSALSSPLLAPDFGNSFGRGLRSAPTFLAVLFIFLIAYFIAAMVFGLILGLLASLGTAVAAIFGFIGFIGIVYLACRVSIISPVIAVEQILNPFTAIGRCWHLTRGKVLPIFVTLLIFAIMAIILFGLLFLIGFGGSFASLAQGVPPSVGGLIGTGIAFMVLALGFAIFGAALISVLHDALAGSTDMKLNEAFE